MCIKQGKYVYNFLMIFFVLKSQNYTQSFTAGECIKNLVNMGKN